jgi:hypothetical protein
VEYGKERERKREMLQHHISSSEVVKQMCVKPAARDLLLPLVFCSTVAPYDTPSLSLDLVTSPMMPRDPTPLPPCRTCGLERVSMSWSTV